MSESYFRNMKYANEEAFRISSQHWTHLFT